MIQHDKYIDIAIEEALKGSGFVSPNPLVGAVLVENEQVIAKGCHKHFGGDHAEVDLFKKLNNRDFSSAVLYVTLEPCSHFGKTPPCSDVIIKSGVKKVVVGMLDPNPLVTGQGVKKLRDAGIDVVVLNHASCFVLNKKFIKYMTTGLPFITLKVAMTVDGYIADKNGNSKYITNESSRAKVMKLRAEHDAIMIGRNTLENDNPHLGVRGINVFKDPIRILLSSSFRVENKLNYNFFRDDNYLIVDNINMLKDKSKDRLITSILVEGGSEVFTNLILSDLVDELVVFVSNGLMGSGNISFTGNLNINNFNNIKRMDLLEVSQFDNDVMLRYSMK